MTAVILTLLLFSVGIAAAAFAAGGTEQKKKMLLWSVIGQLLSFAAGTTLFFLKAPVKEIILQKVQQPPLPVLLSPLPSSLMLTLGAAVFIIGIILFLWSFNCRRNSSAWYWGVLWTLGVSFYVGHILFMPIFYGCGAWLELANFKSATKAAAIIIPFFAMLGCFLTAGSLWTWHTLKKTEHSWKNILLFAGCYTLFALCVWSSARGAGTLAQKAVNAKAAVLGITPYHVTMELPPGVKALNKNSFYAKHAKYNPPRSGRYDWSKEPLPKEVKEYTIKFFNSQELEAFLTNLQKSASFIAKKDVFYITTLQDFRSLVCHRADIAELYARTGQSKKVLPELLKYPELEALIPQDTSFLLCELLRTAARKIWLETLIQYGPTNKSDLPVYRNLLEWSKTWKVHLPCEAGYYLYSPPESQSTLASFFHAPYLHAARYRRFTDAVSRIPALKNMEQQEVIPGNTMYANAAKKQRLGIILGRTALALKLYKAEHGKYPRHLSALVPHYLPKVCVSPYTGKELTYSVKEYTRCRTLFTPQSKIHKIVREQHFTLASDGTSITSNWRY